MEQYKKGRNSNADLYRYMGLATQILVALAAGIFTGLKLDRWLSFSIPFLVWMLPLIIIAGITWQIFRDTSKK